MHWFMRTSKLLLYKIYRLIDRIGRSPSEDREFRLKRTLGVGFTPLSVCGPRSKWDWLMKQ